jgi:hypothetical protein
MLMKIYQKLQKITFWSFFLMVFKPVSREKQKKKIIIPLRLEYGKLVSRILCNGPRDFLVASINLGGGDGGKKNPLLTLLFNTVNDCCVYFAVIFFTLALCWCVYFRYVPEDDTTLPLRMQQSLRVLSHLYILFMLTWLFVCIFYGAPVWLYSVDFSLFFRATILFLSTSAIVLMPVHQYRFRKYGRNGPYFSSPPRGVLELEYFLYLFIVALVLFAI